MIDLLPEQMEAVKRILAEHVPTYEVRVFGSRIKQTAKKWSDLDLAVVGTETLGRDVFHELKEAFEESTLSIQIDVLDWNAISPEFQAVINEDYEVIQQSVQK
jgi:type I restriction enzyme S subunit